MKKGTKWLIMLAVIAMFYFFFLAGPTGLIRLLKLKKKETEILKEIDRTRAEIELIQLKLQKIKEDTTFIKKLASTYLKMREKDQLRKDSTKKIKIRRRDVK